VREDVKKVSKQAEQKAKQAKETPVEPSKPTGPTPTGVEETTPQTEPQAGGEGIVTQEQLNRPNTDDESIGGWLERHKIKRDNTGKFIFYHGTPKVGGASDTLRKGSLLAETKEDAEFYAGRDRDLSPDDIIVHELHLSPDDIEGGHFASLRNDVSTPISPSPPQGEAGKEVLAQDTGEITPETEKLLKPSVRPAQMLKKEDRSLTTKQGEYTNGKWLIKPKFVPDKLKSKMDKDLFTKHPDSKDLYPDTEQTGGAEIVGVQPIEKLSGGGAHIADAYVLRNSNGQEIGINKWYYDYLNKNIKDFNVKFDEPDRPITIYSGDEVAGIVMPIVIGQSEGDITYIKPQVKPQPTFLEKNLTPEEIQRSKSEKGSTTILSDLIIETASIAKTAVTKPVDTIIATGKLVNRNVKKGADHIRTLGGGGRLLAEDLDEITALITRKANTDASDTELVYRGLTKSGREKVSKIVNGRIKSSNKELNEKADQLREVLDRSMNDAKSVGIKRMVNGRRIPLAGSGKAFPQVPNEAGKKFLDEAESQGKGSARVFAWAQEQVKSGNFKDVDQAITALQNFRDLTMRGFNRYLESQRVELPEEFIEWDGKNVLPSLYEKAWTTVEGVRKWGDKFELVNSRSERIATEYGKKEAERVKLFIRTAFGVESPASAEAQIISNQLRGYQFTTKVALSPLTIARNMADRIAKAMTESQNPIVHLKALAQYPPFLNEFIFWSRRIEDEMIRRGAVFGHGSLAEGYEAGSIVSDILTHPFTSSERGNQVYIALIKYHQLKADLAKLDKISNKTPIADYLKRKSLNPFERSYKERLKEHGGKKILAAIEKGEPVTEDMISDVLHYTVRDRAYPMVISTKPLWYDTHPFVKVAAQFKTWPVRQTQMIYNDVLKYTVKTGDPSRLIGFLLGTLIAGEIYNILRDFLYNKDESMLSGFLGGKDEASEYAVRALNDLADGGVVGMLVDFSYGLYNWVKGPIAGTAKNIAELATSTYKEPVLAPQAFTRLIEKEVAPARQIKSILDKIDAKVINEDNIIREYYTYRAAAFEFKDGYLKPTWKEKVIEYTDDVIWGKDEYKPGDTTLTHQMLARQITVGDYEDAKRYVKLALKKEDKSVLLRTMKTHYSPVGPVRQSERDSFYRQLEEDGRDAKRIQDRWVKSLERIVDSTERTRSGRREW